jgi:GNAT superfamily N-acetyltransferase
MIAIGQPTAADIDVLHPLLRESYWSPGIPRETVERACALSLCAIARDSNGVLTGFARAVSDRTVFAWVCDVMVVPAHRGAGLGRQLVRTLMECPDMQTVRRWMLGTADAHGVYAELGFAPIRAPERLMEVIRPAHYMPPKG